MGTRTEAHVPGGRQGQYTLFAPNSPLSPKVCRDFVSGVLTEHALAHLVDAAALCTSELVTNVHVHTESQVHLRLAIEAARVRVAVYDRSPVLPDVRRAGDGDTGGRGLFLVAALADVCGTTGDGRRSEGDWEWEGKGVWFELNV
ncbi:ATP-binding protein [Streptomyces sp. NPDC003077]|uniref:ATP-binding protein n=1 Tax=Streptomyces sp. NPDC003077 TaxID=3154443 RepID=UPI0033A656F3